MAKFYLKGEKQMVEFVSYNGHFPALCAGTAMSLDYMNDPQAPPVGTKGIVAYVDDIGTVHVRWETGSCLGIAYGEDTCHRI